MIKFLYYSTKINLDNTLGKTYKNYLINLYFIKFKIAILAIKITRKVNNKAYYKSRK